MNDPIGQAISDFYYNGYAEDIQIHTNYTEDEHISPAYFFRTEPEMPRIEKKALQLGHGRVLDVGAAAGCHSLVLQKQGLDVTALEKSKLAAEVLVKRGIKNVVCANLFDFKESAFDTILLLMNGTGIGGSLSGLKQMLLHLKGLLSENGSILIDSSDIRYLFEEEDGSVWIDLANNSYYGEMDYQVTYRNVHAAFKWLFADFDTLKVIAEAAGLNCEKVTMGEHYDYLARLMK